MKWYLPQQASYSNHEASILRLIGQEDVKDVRLWVYQGTVCSRCFLMLIYIYIYILLPSANLYFFYFFYWSIVALWYCISFRCAKQWITVFKRYTSFIVIKYWLYSPYCTIYPCSLFYTWQFATLNVQPLHWASPSLSPLVTTSLFSVSVSLLLFCYIH